MTSHNRNHIIITQEQLADDYFVMVLGQHELIGTLPNIEKGLLITQQAA